MKLIDMSRMDQKQRKDAVNEVKVLASLKHPYVVSYRESFAENRSLAIVMDYAEGGDLHQRIVKTRQAGKYFTEDRILRWFTEATLALKYLHDKHVLHRDLKSQNLFLTAQDRLRLGDFGISKVLESTCAFAQTTIGTPYYLSPEICMEKPYSFSSDIWALGCILYEMCVLRVPFDAQSLQALVQKITRGPAPLLPTSFSQELRQLCCDLLNREQSARPLAQEILQLPLVQGEIRRMLREEQSKANGRMGQAPTAVDQKRQATSCSERDTGPPPGTGASVSTAAPSAREREPPPPLNLPPEGAENRCIEEGPFSGRHRQQPTPRQAPLQLLKGVGASVCMDAAPMRVRDPSPARFYGMAGVHRMPSYEPISAGVPIHGTPGGLRRRY